MRTFRFRSMGTDVTLIGPGGGAFARAGAAVRELFEVEDRRFSRFRPDSELSAVNRAAGRPVRVSAPFAEVTDLALTAAHGTGGLFDPTLLHALVEAGYDRDFAEIDGREQTPLRPAPGGAWRAVRLSGDTVRLPAGAGLDLGGIAKGWAVDRAAAVARAEGLGWAQVSAGGDLRLAGRPEAGHAEVPVTDPDDPAAEPVATLRLSHGAVATSSVSRRAWGEGRHHLIDPRDGLPARTGVVQATVWARTCAEAEVAAKWALLTGPDALAVVPGVLVMEDGRVLVALPEDERSVA